MRDFLKNFKLNEQNISMVLGVVVVFLIGSLLYNYFKSVNEQPEGDTSSSATEDQTQLPTRDELPATYKIQSGDSLWSISEEVYGTGYNWSDVYAANRETIGTNPNRLLEGTTINLPDIEPKVTALPATSSGATEYHVQKGDHLWGILVRTCANGHLWPQVARTNNISDGNLIEPGQVLTISCN